MKIDKYDSVVRQDGVFGVFYERDDDTAYLYFCRTTDGDTKIVEAFNVGRLVDPTAVSSETVRWSPDGAIAGLFVDTTLVAVFEAPAEHDAEVSKGRAARPADAQRFRLLM